MPRSNDIQENDSGISPVKLSDLTRHLGTIKNELLIFVVLTIIITDLFAYALVKTQDTISKVCGACMGGSTVLMFFLSVLLYFYAMLRLPGTKQELMFEDSAQKTLKAHSRAKRRQVETSLDPQA